MWLAYLPIPVFGATIALRFLLRAWEQARIMVAPAQELD
jgi:C4-dicarboxylate transporter DctQ subunit